MNLSAVLRAALLGLLAAAISPFAGVRASQDTPPPLQAAANPPGLHDFDFLVGSWHVRHHKLKERLLGSHDWAEFDGSCVNFPLMQGWANTDDNVFNVPGGAYRGVGLRSFDPKSSQWAIWWLDGRDPFGDMDPPVKGRFEHGVGNFYASDTLRGKKIRVRYTWSNITPTSARWEQAYSPDEGQTWEVNWTMEFTRVP